MTTPRHSSPLGVLRALTPDRPLTIPEAQHVAEVQALRLLLMSGVDEPAVPEHVIADLPYVTVERSQRLPGSGATAWEQGRWRIVVSTLDSYMRQRFTLAHELKHVLDHPYRHHRYASTDLEQQLAAERICDYFAACLLMPKAWVKKAYCRDGVQDLRVLARHFGVSVEAMRIRLHHLGLVDDNRRCTYQRASAGLATGLVTAA